MEKIPAVLPSDNNENISIENLVLNFFLNLYKIQLGIIEEENEEVESSIECLDPDTPGPDHTYELRVMGSEPKSRRMALSLLGENSGSKSKCFKVTYDDVLVIKIPPSPIQDFDEYIECIKIERKIVDKLTPDIECIAPSLSAILRKNSRIACDYELSPDEIEQNYVEALRKSPWLQDYLKINDSFVFFMNLSKYSFLGHVIEKMHNLDEKMHEEIFGQIDILWNMMAFEGVYGVKNAHIYFDISEIYNEYEDKTNVLMKKHRLNPSLFIYKKKEWFLLSLTDKQIKSGDKTLPQTFLDELNKMIQKIFINKHQAITAYQTMMKQYVYDKMFKQNKAQFKGIVANMLELLYWLKIRGVAIRDLKPDNMFVVGGCFLQQANEFSLGLIDFETAVNFKVPVNKEIKQPLLAGTPSYATPSHLTKNEILKDTLKNLPRILYLQDWNAALVMIFYIVTGDHLFFKTRRWIAETGQTMQESSKNNISLPESFKKCSTLFWYSAVNEFKVKINAYRKLLESIEIVLSENVKNMILQELNEESKIIMEEIKIHIDSQNFFKSKKSHQDLIRSSYITINRCKKNWETGVNVPKTKPETRLQIIKLLQNIEQLKLDFEERTRLIKLFKNEISVISIYSLLKLMHQIVFKAMYRNYWGDISDESVLLNHKYADVDNKTLSYNTDIQDKTISYEATVSYAEDSASYEKTISFENTSETE